MIGYYLQLAFTGLGRNVWLTALIVMAVAVGIGSSMTVYTVLHTLSGDPIPQKSTKLFAPYVDIRDPATPIPPAILRDLRAGMLSYPDAIALSKIHQAFRQASMYATTLTVLTGDRTKTPVRVPGQATQAEFFTLFDVPFRAGNAWGAKEDESRANVVVITEALAEHFFPGTSAVGQTLTLGSRDFQVIGVTEKWAPFPPYYDTLGETDAAKAKSGPQLFVPIETAEEEELPPVGAVSTAFGRPFEKWPTAHVVKTFLDTPDILSTQLWVELPTAADTQRYRQMLDGYAAEQQRLGRFGWKPATKLVGMREWLSLSPQTVSMREEFEIAGWMACGFLLVCMVNAMALMLARFARRSADLTVRRALGAPRSALFTQCLVETAVIGALGGVLGVLLTLLGLQVERASIPRAMVRAAQLDGQLVALTVAFALIATLCAGLYPAWRSSCLPSARQLKVQ